jgi:aminoglycoside phosphotransferase (APT) family kinase protein
MARPDSALLSWAAAAAAPPGAAVEEVIGLRDGGSPWLLRFSGPDGPSAVLRLADADDAGSLATEAAALETAVAHGVPAPRLLATDLHGEVCTGVAAVLTTAVAGTSHLSGEPSPARWGAMAVVIAAIHRIRLAPSAALAARDRPINTVDFTAVRRSAPPRALLVEGERVLALLPVPAGGATFVHGDFWFGNTMFDGEALTGVIDWDCAGVGLPGIDVGSLRLDAHLCSGPAAAQVALAEYERSAGHPADDVAYWDLVAALATPPTMGWFVGAIHGQGRSDLDQATLIARRDSFLSSALDRLR